MGYATFSSDGIEFIKKEAEQKERARIVAILETQLTDGPEKTAVLTEIRGVEKSGRLDD